MVKLSEFDNFGVEDMPGGDYEKKQAELQKLCKCATCPTFVKGDAMTAYCFPLSGTSKKIQKEIDCICKTCPVFKEYELTHSFYCTRCSQVCQAYKAEVGAAGHE